VSESLDRIIEDRDLECLTVIAAIDVAIRMLLEAHEYRAVRILRLARRNALRHWMLGEHD
jgi:hypothetical protein